MVRTCVWDPTIWRDGDLRITPCSRGCLSMRGERPCRVAGSCNGCYTTPPRGGLAILKMITCNGWCADAYGLGTEVWVVMELILAPNTSRRIVIHVSLNGATS